MTADRFFLIKPSEGFEWMIGAGDEARPLKWYKVLQNLPNTNSTDPWRPFPAQVVAPLDGQDAMRAAMPWCLQHVLILRDEAIESVGHLLGQHGRLLPLDGRNARLAVFSAPLLDDALIEEESELHRNFPWDEFPRLVHGVFDAAVVGELKAFTISPGRAPWLVLRESLVREIEATGDTAGVSFRPAGVVGAVDS